MAILLIHLKSWIRAVYLAFTLPGPTALPFLGNVLLIRDSKREYNNYNISVYNEDHIIHAWNKSLYLISANCIGNFSWNKLIIKYVEQFPNRIIKHICLIFTSVLIQYQHCVKNTQNSLHQLHEYIEGSCFFFYFKVGGLTAIFSSMQTD